LAIGAAAVTIFAIFKHKPAIRAERGLWALTGLDRK
jgi:hypothetical protein